MQETVPIEAFNDPNKFFTSFGTPFSKEAYYDAIDQFMENEFIIAIQDEDRVIYVKFKKHINIKNAADKPCILINGYKMTFASCYGFTDSIIMSRGFEKDFEKFNKNHNTIYACMRTYSSAPFIYLIFRNNNWYNETSEFPTIALEVFTE